ncbi:MAG: M15 family metallopeptidase [Bacteroidia bacterium]
MLLRSAILLLLFWSCADGAKKRPEKKQLLTTETLSPQQIVVEDVVDSAAINKLQNRKRDSFASIPLLKAGLVNVQQVAPEILVELRYSTTTNFLGFDIYGDLNTAFLQPDVAQMLAAAQKELSARRPGYKLLIYDAARPISVQQLMWDTLRNRPLDRSKYVSNPANGGSLHNYGAAVDLTIADSTGQATDMGTPYDFFGPEAHPSKEAEMLAAGKLTAEQIENRKLLREVMRSAGFFGITSEWWHFNACTRTTAKEKYKLLN